MSKPKDIDYSALDENNTRGKGFGGSAKPAATQDKSSALSPIEPMATVLGDSYKAYGAEVIGLISDFQGSTHELNDKLSDAYLAMTDGSWAAQDLMQQISEKAKPRKTAKFKVDLGFEPPSITDGIEAVEEFYTKTSFLRGSQPKQITGK